MSAKERAIERICRIKEIDPKKNNLSIICYDLSSISEYAKVDNNIFKLMKRNLPGPFTFILNGTNRLPKIFRNRKEVGIRMPDNSIIREIARLLDAPIMTTTLPHDEHEDIEYVTDPELIDEKLGDVVDLVIDGGIGGIEPSTVVNCTEGEAAIVRQGKGELEECSTHQTFFRCRVLVYKTQTIAFDYEKSIILCIGADHCHSMQPNKRFVSGGL